MWGSRVTTQMEGQCGIQLCDCFANDYLIRVARESDWQWLRTPLAKAALESQSHMSRRREIRVGALGLQVIVSSVPFVVFSKCVPIACSQK